MGHLERTPLTPEDLHRIEFHGSFEWLSSVAFDYQAENPSLPVWLADAATVLEETAQLLRAQAVSALRSHGSSVRDIEKQIGLSKSGVDRVNQLGPYTLTTDDAALDDLANAVMATVWAHGNSSGRWEDFPRPEPVVPKAISAQLVRQWIRNAGIDTESMTIEDLTETFSVDSGEDGIDVDDIVVEHHVVIPGLDDVRRRAVRGLLASDMGLQLSTISNALGTDRWSIPAPEDLD